MEVSVGDLIQVKDSGFSDTFNEKFLGRAMLVTGVSSTWPGRDDVKIAPVVEVLGPYGPRRFNMKDVEVISESR